MRRSMLPMHRLTRCPRPARPAGGGAIDMELSKALRDHARTIAGKSQLFISAFAKALEVIPRQLCDNAGFDATDVLNKLRQKHALPDGSGKVRGPAACRNSHLLQRRCSAGRDACSSLG